MEEYEVVNNRNSEQLKTTTKKFHDLQKKYSILEKENKEMNEKYNLLDKDKKSISDKYTKLTTRVKNDNKNKGTIYYIYIIDKIKQYEEETYLLHSENEKYRIALSQSEKKNAKLVREIEAKDETISNHVQNLKFVHEERVHEIENREQTEILKKEILTKMQEYEKEIRTKEAEKNEMARVLNTYSDYESMKNDSDTKSEMIINLRGEMEDILAQNRGFALKIESIEEDSSDKIGQIISLAKLNEEFKLALSEETIKSQRIEVYL